MNTLNRTLVALAFTAASGAAFAAPVSTVGDMIDYPGQPARSSQLTREEVRAAARQPDTTSEYVLQGDFYAKNKDYAAPDAHRSRAEVRNEGRQAQRARLTGSGRVAPWDLA